MSNTPSLFQSPSSSVECVLAEDEDEDDVQTIEYQVVVQVTDVSSFKPEDRIVA